MEDYNAQFKIGELIDSLTKSHDTTVGPDDIHYQMLKAFARVYNRTLLIIWKND